MPTQHYLGLGGKINSFLPGHQLSHHSRPPDPLRGSAKHLQLWLV